MISFAFAPRKLEPGESLTLSTYCCARFTAQWVRVTQGFDVNEVFFGEKRVHAPYPTCDTSTEIRLTVTNETGETSFCYASIEGEKEIPNKMIILSFPSTRIEAGETKTLLAHPKIRFRPHRLLIHPDVAPCFEVGALLFTRQSVLPQSLKAYRGELFNGQRGCLSFSFPSLLQDTPVRLLVKNVSAETQTCIAQIQGERELPGA